MKGGPVIQPASLLSSLPNGSAARKEFFHAADQAIRENSRTFYFATSLLPQTKRRAIRALYAFCRTADDLVDEHNATADQMEAWRAEVCLPAQEQRDPILYLWAETRDRFRVDPRYQDELITGVTADISPSHPRTWEETERYCYLVASTVGLLSIPIVGLRRGVSFERAAPYAIKLGIALQLTNILRDIGEDAARGRVYLPEDDLRRFDLTRADILTGLHDERFQSLMQFEIERARRLYREALPGIAMLSISGQLAVGAAALLYRAILDEIEAICYRVHHVRAHTSGRKKLAMMPQIFMTVISLRPPL